MIDLFNLFCKVKQIIQLAPGIAILYNRVYTRGWIANMIGLSGGVFFMRFSRFSASDTLSSL